VTLDESGTAFELSQGFVQFL